MIYEENIIFEDITDPFRKGLIVYLPSPKRSNPHWYVFLTDLVKYIDRQGNEKEGYLIINLSSNKKNRWKSTYNFKMGMKNNHYLHSHFINKSGIMVYEKAKLLTEDEIRPGSIKSLPFENITLVHVDRILSKIPKSSAPKDVKDFYETTLDKSKKSRKTKNPESLAPENIVETLNKLLYEIDHPTKESKISKLLKKSSSFRSRRNRRIRESYRDYY